MTHYFIECFLRTAGYNGAEHGHGATFAARLSNGMLTINHAAGTEEGILSEDITYEELCRRFEYIAWQLVSVHRRKLRLSGVSEMNLMISTSKP